MAETTKTAFPYQLRSMLTKCMNMPQKFELYGMQEFDASYCLDAPDSIPAGGTKRLHFPSWSRHIANEEVVNRPGV